MMKEYVIERVSAWVSVNHHISPTLTVTWEWLCSGRVNIMNGQDSRLMLEGIDHSLSGILLQLARRTCGCDEWRRLTVEPAGKGWCICLRNARHRPPSKSSGGWDLDKEIVPAYLGQDGLLGRNEFDTEEEALLAVLEVSPKLFKVLNV